MSSIFDVSPRAQDLKSRLLAFMAERVYPNETLWAAQIEEDRWRPPPIIEELKRRARSEGLWNLFLPDAAQGAGLTNLEYAPLAEIMGRSIMAPEVFNCSAPDTGNMEVLVRYGSPEQKKQWLVPLPEGTIRPAFAMTEPQGASSHATNNEASIAADRPGHLLQRHQQRSSGTRD